MTSTDDATLRNVRAQPLERVMEAYNLIDNQPCGPMDQAVLEQAPIMAAEAARTQTDEDLTKLLARLEKGRLEDGASAIPAWAVWSQVLFDEALRRYPQIEATVHQWQDNPDYSSPLHAAADALDRLTSK